MILNKQKSEEVKEEAEADLFSDMAPTIRKLVFLWWSENSEKESHQNNCVNIRQKKIFIGDRGGGGGEERGSRLRAVEHDPLVSSPRCLNCFMIINITTNMIRNKGIQMKTTKNIIQFIRWLREQSLVLGRRVQQTLLAGNPRMRTWAKFLGELYFHN